MLHGASCTVHDFEARDPCLGTQYKKELFFFLSLLIAYTLGSLNNLEELILPNGDGIYQVAKLIIQQCQHLRCLRVLSFTDTLNDDSIMEIGELSSGLSQLA